MNPVIINGVALILLAADFAEILGVKALLLRVPSSNEPSSLATSA